MYFKLSVFADTLAISTIIGCHVFEEFGTHSPSTKSSMCFATTAPASIQCQCPTPLRTLIPFNSSLVPYLRKISLRPSIGAVLSSEPAISNNGAVIAS